MRISAIVVLFAALSIAACASVPMATVDQDLQGKRFEPPATGKGALYLFRETKFGASILLNITIGQRAVGALAADTWYRIDLEPGTHDVRCTGEDSASLVIELVEGQTRFVEVAARLGVLSARCGIFEVAAEQGRKAVMAGRRALDIH